jgi:hypothetical protein
MDGHEVHARHTEEGRAGGVSRGVLTVSMGRAWRGGRPRGQGCCGARFDTRVHDREGACDLGVACAQLGGVAIAQCEGLLKDKAMRLTPGAGQRLGHLVSILVAAVVPHGCEGTRVALARDHGADDPLPRGACHIAARLGSLHSHLQERLLPRNLFPS